MNGKQVKEILKKSGYTLNYIAKAMDVSPQNLQSMLRAEDIKTGVLEKIAESINESLYLFLEDNNKGNTITGSNNTAISGNGNKIHAETDKFIEMIKKKDEQIDRLLTIIETSKK